MTLRKVKPLTENELIEQAKLDFKFGNTTPYESRVAKEVGIFGHARQPPAGVKDLQKNGDWMEGFEEIKPSKSTFTKGTALSIVNNKHDKRVNIAKEALEALDFPKAVRFLVNNEKKEVYILAATVEEVAHNLTGKPTKNVVYSKALVERLTLLFELDYSSRTSCAIGTWKVIEKEGMTMIVVTDE